MRSPSRLGNPALGMPLTRTSSTPASWPRIGSSDCGPSVQFAPMTCTFFVLSCAAASAGLKSPYAVPSSEYVSCAMIGRPENERIASIASVKFLDVGERFEDEEIDAALFEGEGLLVKNVENFVGLGMARLHADAERTDRTGDQNFARCGLARFAGDFHAAAVEFLHVVAEAERLELEAIRSEGIRLDDLRAGFDVSLCARKTASGSVAFNSSRQRCAPTRSCRYEPIAPSAIKIEFFRRSLKSWIFKTRSSCLLNCARDLRSAFGFHEAGDGAHEVVLGENLEARFAHFDEDGGILVTQNVRDAIDRRGARNLRQRLAHDFAHDELVQIFALQRESQNLIFVDRADRQLFPRTPESAKCPAAAWFSARG